MDTTLYQITTVPVYGGFDLIISYGGDEATLFIHDESQATDIGQRIITIAVENKIGINAAFALFNQGSGMFGG